jgi:hypothetical protein
MKNKAQEIAKQIKQLLDQLVALSGAGPSARKPSAQVIPPAQKGCSGGISILAEEGFFDSPKDLSVITGRLKEIGRHYSQSTVSMNLLNLTKRRTFNRLKDTKTKKWQYVLRK